MASSRSDASSNASIVTWVCSSSSRIAPRTVAAIGASDRNRLSRVATRPHAAGIRGLGLLVVLVDVVQTIQGPADGPDETPDRGALPRALAAACYSAPCRPNRCASSASDGNVLHHLDSLVPLTRRR